MPTELTAERLRELLDYDAATGEFTWVRNRNTNLLGRRAGWTAERGKRTIEVDGRNYAAHRLAWLYSHDAWPIGVIDHKDGDPSNNRIDNLRDTNQSVNQQNRRRPRKGSRSGVLGVNWLERVQKWWATIYVNGRSKSLGRYKTVEEAHQAYITAKRLLHEGCTI